MENMVVELDQGKCFAFSSEERVFCVMSQTTTDPRRSRCRRLTLRGEVGQLDI